MTKVLVRHRAWDKCLETLQHFPREDLIVSILSRALDELLLSGRVAALKSWLDLAKRSHVGHPILLAAEAEVALRERDGTRAQALGERGGDLLESGDLAARSYLTAARAAHFQEDADAIRRNCDRAHALARSGTIRFEASCLALMQAIEVQDPEVGALFERLARLPAGDPDRDLRVACAKALIAFEKGDPRAAENACELAAALMTYARDPLARTSYLNLFGHFSIVRGRYERAVALADRQQNEATSNGLAFAADYSLIIRAAALTSLRRFALARRALDELQQSSTSASGNITANITICVARLRIAVGDLEGARIVLLRPHTESLQRAWAGELIAYRALVASSMDDLGGAEQALNELTPFKPYFEASTVGHLARAVLALQVGNSNAAAVEAVAGVISRGHHDAVVIACRAYPPLAIVCAQHASMHNSLRSILTDSRDLDLGKRAGLEMPRELRRTEGLSPREREVHELLAQGRSNREIARALFISVSTAKVHVRHIFEKLGVHTRTEAARAPVSDPAD